MNYTLRCDKRRYTDSQLEIMEWANNQNLDISKYDYPDRYDANQMRQLYEADLLGIDLKVEYDWRILSEIKLAKSQGIMFDISEVNDSTHIQMIVSREAIISNLKKDAKMIIIHIPYSGDIDFLLLGSLTIYKLQDDTYRFDTQKYKFITKDTLLHLLINGSGGIKSHPSRKELLDMNFSELFKGDK